MWEIRERDGRWEIVADDETLSDHDTYEQAVGTLAVTLADLAGDGTGEAGLLPETWVADLAFSEQTSDGRDFTNTDWTARNPDESTMPLMLQTETEMGHFGAELAGYFTTIADLGEGTAPVGRGRFYDNESGRQLRDMLLGDRSFGVSVDPGSVDAEWTCLEEDADGFCVEEKVSFSAYEIIGVTATPFPAFARAAIRLDTPALAAAVTPIYLNERTQTPLELPEGIDLLHPPADWFYTPEPQLGEPFALGSLGDEWLVDQGQGRVAMPLSIGDDGRVAGHGAVWGQYHSGFPGRRITPPLCAESYFGFHVGYVVAADGTKIPTGALSASCDHAVGTLRAAEARDSYAHNGVAWANVRVVNGQHGPWVSGALRHDVTQEQVAVLRAGALSGDWRGIEGNMELIAWLAVTTPGFAIAREALVASGLRIPETPAAAMTIRGGEQISLVAAGVVRRCPDCARRAAAAEAQAAVVDEERPDLAGALVRLDRNIALLERRTRHLVEPAAAHAAHRIRG